MTSSVSKKGVIYDITTGIVESRIGIGKSVEWTDQFIPDGKGLMTDVEFEDDGNLYQVDDVDNPTTLINVGPDPGLIETLEQIKASARLDIDEKCSEIRNTYISTGIGMEMTYQRKEAEARSYLAANNPVDTDYPFLVGEALARSLTIAEMAAFIIAQADAWLVIGSQIETLRMSAKVAIDAAPDAASVEAIVEGFEFRPENGP